jgi:xanthine dehydrogenase YagS FAD-binding subunit
MRPFAYERAADVASAVRLGAASGQGQSDARAQFLAGGTTLIDLMKLDDRSSGPRRV